MINTGPSAGMPFMGSMYGGQTFQRPSYGGQPTLSAGIAGGKRPKPPAQQMNKMGPVRPPMNSMSMGMSGMRPPLNPSPVGGGQMNGGQMNGGGINTAPTNLGNDMMTPPPMPMMNGIAGPSRGPIMGPGGQSTGIFGQYGQSPNRRY